MDQGFWYGVPEHLHEGATVGRIVRVPLSGRRVRGWIVERVLERPNSLKDLVSLSGDLPVFGEDLLSTLIWASTHYVAPTSVVLNKATPPNLPRARKTQTRERPEVRDSSHPLSAMVESAATGRRRPSQALVGRWQGLDWLGELAPILHRGDSAMVLAASAAEVKVISRVAGDLFGSVVIDVAGETDADLTESWLQSQTPGALIIGTPRVAAWDIASLDLAIVLEEGRRAMKERQTPTIHVRDLIRRRSLVEGFGVVYYGPTPSVETLATGAEITRVGNRAWPLVEIVDRSDEPPGSGLISDSVIAALRAVSARGERCFVFTFRKMVDPTVVEINAKLGSPSAGPHPHSRLITVGTERDLAGLDGLGLAVAANVDGMLLGPGYRTSEEALRQLARLANALDGGHGHRMMAQAMDPRLPLVDTLRRGDPIPYLERVLVERGRAGVPPSTEMLAIELRQSVPEDADASIRQLPDAEVIGPLDLDSGQRWLLEGRLAKARLALRPLVGRWREEGTTVRVDADPIDL